MSELVEGIPQEIPPDPGSKERPKLLWLIVPLLAVVLVVVVACAGPAVGNIYGNIVSAL